MKQNRSALLTPVAASAAICLALALGALAKQYGGFAHSNLFVLAAVLAAALWCVLRMRRCLAKKTRDEEPAEQAPRRAGRAVQLCGKPLVFPELCAGRGISYRRKPQRRTG